MTRTLHFLLTDIEGSTRRWEAEPDEMRPALAHHDALLRDVVSTHGGRVVKGAGDGIWAVFERPEPALSAAVEAQRHLHDVDWTTDEPLRIRVALHRVPATEVEERDHDFFGPGANRCARLIEVGHGEQVIASDAFRNAVGPVDGIGFRDLGSHRLRDLHEPERIHQVTHPDLPASFPPLRSLDAFPHNLPVQRTTFVGRDGELAELIPLVRDERLVTLTGAGGAGKTRLALATAAALVQDFDDGVWLTDLAALRDGELVAQEVASSIGLREQPGRALEDVLVDHLRTRRLLLVLDNCEHLVAACARLADRLLASSSGLHVLATSRERLQVPGERIRVVPPLPVGTGSGGFPVHADAVQLFVDRAVAVNPELDPSEEDLRAIARICRRLDGIPLALELAAARLHVLSPTELVTKLDDRFQLLTGGPRTAVPQHQTLRATLDWSHELLDEDERVLFRRLAAFAAPVPLHAVEQVASDDLLPRPRVLDHLDGLVAKSLVVTDRTEETTRYGMLETVREYAGERLLEADEAQRTRDAHADWLLDVAAQIRSEQGETTFIDPDAVPPDDIRMGLNWLTATRPRDALELATTFANLWWVRGRLAEGRAHLETALDAVGDDVDPGLRARAHTGLATLAVSQGDMEAAARYAGPVVDAGGRYRSRIVCLWVTGIVAWVHGELDVARAVHTEGMELAREIGYSAGERFNVSAYARVLRSAGDLDEAVEIYEHMLSRPDVADRASERAWALDGLARVSYLRGDIGAARRQAEEALELYEEIGYVEGLASALDVLGLAAVAEGELGVARTHLTRAAEIGLRIGHRGALAATLEACAMLAAAEDAPERAAQLLGCVDSLRDELGAVAGGADELVAGRLRGELADRLGDRLEELRREGSGLDLDRAVRLGSRPT